MKTIVALVAASILSLNAIAGDPPHGDKYCVNIIDGKKVVVHEGKQILENVALKDGTQVLVDGTIIKPDGSKVLLNAGECIDKEGAVVPEKKDKK